MEKQEKQESKRLPGFYIALCCCVIAIGIAGYFTERNSEDTIPNSSVNNAIPQSEIVSKDENNAVAVNEIVQTAEETEENITVSQPQFPEIEVYTPEDTVYDVSEEEIAETAVIVTEPVFTKPLQGEILESFSKELSYNNALCDWRAHTGVDIAGEIGASVSAMGDGTVTKISSDEMGKYVEVDHGNGFLARYSRLLSTESCEAGKEIKSGEVIGTVCEGSGENVSAPHLHLELYKDGKAVNPMEYIKE